MTFLEVRNLSISAGSTVVVRDVSFRLETSQSLTLLGETGSGKSLLAQAIMGNLPAGLYASGTIFVFGEESAAGEQAKRRHHWGHALALLPQEPWRALDPTMRVVSQIAEGYARVKRLSGGAPATLPKLLIQGVAGRKHITETRYNLVLQTVTAPAPFTDDLSFQYFREWGGASNAYLLIPGTYKIGAWVRVGMRSVLKTVNFSIDGCTFNPSLVIDF